MRTASRLPGAAAVLLLDLRDRVLLLDLVAQWQHRHVAVPSVDLVTTRLLLRPISLAEAPSLAEVYGHPDVSRYIATLDAVATAQQVSRFVEEWEQRGHGVLSIYHRVSGEFLGRSGLHYWPQLDEVEVGWVLRRDVWGKGYATEAGAASLRWGLEELKLSAIIAIVARDNAPSVAVAERLEMSPIRDDHIFGHPVTVFSRSARRHLPP